MSREIRGQVGRAALVSRFRVPTKVVIAACERLGNLRPEWFAERVRRPHFIVGCGRSGTTMLNYLFNLHPEVANFPSEANKLWHPQLYPWHESKVPSPPFWFDPQKFTEISLAHRTPADDLHVRSTFGAFQTLARKPVFLAKTVQVSFMIDKVLELFPEARFIQLVRDGRAVALSWVAKNREKLKHPRFAEHNIHFEDDELPEIYVKYWQKHITALDEAVTRLRLRETDRYHEMSYEALCADPKTHLVGLADFLGISTAPFATAPLDHIKNSNHKAREAFDASQLSRLNTAAAAALRSRDYGLDIR